MDSPPLFAKSNLLSLRAKVLIAFTLLFSSVFGFSFYWFYTFTLNKTTERLYTDMRQTVEGAAQDIEPEEVIELYASGTTDQDLAEAGWVLDNSIFQKHLTTFQDVNKIEPRAWLYTYVMVDQSPEEFAANIDLASAENRPPIITQDSLADLNEEDSLSTVFLTDLWVNHDPDKAAKFLEPIPSNEFHIEAMRGDDFVDRPLYDDGFFGSWITTYYPLKNAEGVTVAVLGVDFEASYVRQIEKTIRRRLLISFLVIYAALFLLVSVLSELLTKPIIDLTNAAAKMGEGDYSHDLEPFRSRQWRDEVSTLADVFALMVSKVKQREESLKMQVKELKIEIDDVKRKHQVQEIVDSDFFQNLQSKSKKIRAAMGRDIEDIESQDS
jgi:methyl-accepting chemotaxis protein